MLRSGTRAVLIALAVLLGAATTTACDETTTEVACDLTGPLIRGIALALKATPETAIGSLVLDAATIPVAAYCKEWMKSQTEPTTAEKFLSTTEKIPPTYRLPVGVGVCGASNTLFGSVAAFFDTTSCPFSINVQSAYLASTRTTPVTVDAWSPTTGKSYMMNCTGEYPVVCTGGDNAAVYIY